MRIKSIVRWSAGVLLALFALMQIRTVEHTNPAVVSEIVAPEDVQSILRKACYDCHSHETRWPWYSYVAPVSWWVVEHVEHGRGDLNFSEWPKFDLEEQSMAFDDIDEQIAKQEMPLASYKLLHSAARLSEEERNRLRIWARSGR